MNGAPLKAVIYRDGRAAHAACYRIALAYVDMRARLGAVEIYIYAGGRIPRKITRCLHCQGGIHRPSRYDN